MGRYSVAKAMGIDWDEQPLGVVPDTEIANRFGISTTPVRNARYERGIAAASHRWESKSIDWDSQPLGEVSDREIARTLGVAQATARRARVSRGIGVVPGMRIDWLSQPLGKMWDAELASRLGVTVPRVEHARRWHGIEKYSEVARCACGAEFERRKRENGCCSTACYWAHQDAVRRHRLSSDHATVHVALVALRREIRQRIGKQNVEID